MKKLCVLLCVMTVVFAGCQATENENHKTTTQSPSTTQSTSLNTDSLAEKVDSYVGSGGEVPTGNTTAQGDSQSGIPGNENPEQTGSTQSGDDENTQEGSTASNRTADFDERDDTVYATTNVVVRNQPSIAGDPVMNLKKGKSVHRVGYSAGWTKVEIKGYFYYIATQYLSETP